MSTKVMWLVVVSIMVLLLINMFICGLFSYWGVGVGQYGPHHLRTGSVSGPVVGGGPGAGK